MRHGTRARRPVTRLAQERPSKGKGSSGDVFENRQRRALRFDQGGWRNQNSLLESILAGDHGMTDAIGEDHPGRVRRKFPAALWRGFLESGVFFHGIVATVHEFVVGRTMTAGKIKNSGEGAKAAKQRIPEGVERTGLAGKVGTK